MKNLTSQERGILHELFYAEIKRRQQGGSAPFGIPQLATILAKLKA